MDVAARRCGRRARGRPRPAGRDRGVLQDARARGAGRPREALGGLDRVAVAEAARSSRPPDRPRAGAARSRASRSARPSRVSMPTERWSATEASMGARIRLSTRAGSRCAGSRTTRRPVLGEVLEELERVPDHPAGLGRGVVLAHAGRALAGTAGSERALVDHDHVADPAPGQVEGGLAPVTPPPMITTSAVRPVVMGPMLPRRRVRARTAGPPVRRSRPICAAPRSARPYTRRRPAPRRCARPRAPAAVRSTARRGRT